MADLDCSWLRQEIERLTKRKQLAFVLLLCARMVPALEKFAQEENFDGACYRDALNTAWHCLEEDRTSSSFGRMAEACLDRAPDTEKFDHPLTSAALNAALSIVATINLVADGNVDHIVEAANLARDTAALYAQAIESIPPRSLSIVDVMKHPLVQRELRQQAEDLKFLQALPAVDSQLLMLLLEERAVGTPKLLPPNN